MARILYVTQWFYPEPNIVKGTKFIRALQAAGHEVEILTGFPNYPTGTLYPGYRLRMMQRETVDGVSVVRVPLYPSHDSSSFGRSLNFLSFFASVLIFLLLNGRRYDLWYVYHPPITPGVAAALAGRLWARRFILEIQDLWPDTVVVSGMTATARMGRLLAGLCRFTYRWAARVLVQSDGIAERLIERGVPAAKLEVVRNWADDSALVLPPPNRAIFGAESGFTLVYGGNLGRMQALDTALEAMGLLQKKGVDATLVLVGDGIERDKLRNRACDLGLRNVSFAGRVPQDEIGQWFASADALLLHIARNPLFSITIPSKTQYYLASGRPVVAGIDGEAASILRASGAALVAPPQDAAALAAAIEAMAAKSMSEREEMGAAGRRYYQAELAFEQGIDKTLALIESTL